MPSDAHEEIRRLLKEFGLTADEAITAYLIEEKPSKPLHLRITLEDRTEYETPPGRALHLEIDGQVSP